MTEATPTLDVFWHPDCWLHDTGNGFFEAEASPYLDIHEQHVENADRVKNIKAMLEKGPLKDHVRWHMGGHATIEDLTRFHDEDYVAAIRDRTRVGKVWLTRTTPASHDSFKAATAAAGTTLAAARCVADGYGRIAYALVRPPGHHAAPAQADGYCLFNNVGVAAAWAIAQGVNRVAILDWDVHHGNGTQEGFYGRADALTVSLHMDHGAWGRSHPQTGKADEVGRGAGRGFNLNVPLPMGTGDAGYARVMEEIVIPAVDAFKPGLLIVASGVDGSQFDPNGRQLLTMAGFHRLGAMARALADRHTGGRLMVAQEGGYNISYTAYCAHAVLAGALGLPLGVTDPLAYLPEDTTRLDALVADLRTQRDQSLAD